MEIQVNELTGKNAEELVTEIRFFVAAAKSTNKDFAKLFVSDEIAASASRLASVLRILKALKREGIIQLFVFSGDFLNASTEMAYLKNKYPEILKEERERGFYLLKI